MKLEKPRFDFLPVLIKVCLIFSGMLSCMVKIFKEEGVAGFYV